MECEELVEAGSERDRERVGKQQNALPTTSPIGLPRLGSFGVKASDLPISGGGAAAAKLQIDTINVSGTQEKAISDAPVGVTATPSPAQGNPHGLRSAQIRTRHSLISARQMGSRQQKWSLLSCRCPARTATAAAEHHHPGQPGATAGKDAQPQPQPPHLDFEIGLEYFVSATQQR